MSLKIAVLKETAADEGRVAVSPETVKKYAALGAAIFVEAGAGEKASFTDEMLALAGATIVPGAEQALANADILLSVQAPPPAHIAGLKKGALVLGILGPYQNRDRLKEWAKAGITALAMELVPRITRAQAMDVLSSQANLAGYKAVIEAASRFNRAFPMMMTAAGTVPPARVLVMGAGVAGLQAIATARRLGAIVSATDVRPAAKEQVASLGASFVAVEDDEFRQAETSGGYAKEMSAAYQEKQQALIEETIAKQDIVITTALIPGRPAPLLVSEKMVLSMKPGSVIVDLAAEQGGNCALSEAGKTVEKHGVTIIGASNMPSRIAASAAALYAKNLQSLVQLLVGKDTHKDTLALAIDWEDEIVKGVALTHDGAVIHPAFGGTSLSTPSAAAVTAAPPTKEAEDAPAQTQAPSTTAKKTTAKPKE